MRAHLNLRRGVPEREAAVRAGLARVGDPDLLCTWNKIGEGERLANQYESQGRPVIVMENAAWGNDFNGERWYTVALYSHNTGINRYDSDRWDSLGVELKPWRTEGETVILGQRGIGANQCPPGWLDKVRKAYPRARLRTHPGMRTDGIPLERDLKHAGEVLTWGSGAAIKACMWGIPVVHFLPAWVGAQDNTDAGRLEMLRHLAYRTWRLSEIASGEAFAHTLGMVNT